MKLKFTIPICACLMLLVVNSAHARLRLRAATNCYYNGAAFIPNDSSSFVYSGYRTGGLVLSTYGWAPSTSCDTAFIRYYNGTTGKYFQSSRTINTYDSHDNVLTQLYQYYDTVSAVWANVNLYTNTYDPGNNQLTSLSQYWDTTHGSGGVWKNISRHAKTYDSHNNNLTDSTFAWYGTYWQIAQLQSFTYDAYNYLVSSTTSYPVSGTLTYNTKTDYSLNAGHKPDSAIEYIWSLSLSAWQNYIKNVYTYDASYNELADTSLFWSGSDTLWQPSFLYLYTYSGGDVASKENRYYNTTTAVWQNNSKDNMSYDAHHNLLTDITQYWKPYKSAYYSYAKAENVYNSNNKVINYTTTSWDSASASWKIDLSSQRSRFYYEPYTGLAVSNVNADHSVMKLYPSPASSYINVDLSNLDNKAAILAIYDATGRLYKQWQTTPGSSYHATVPVNALPAGNYFLEMREGQAQKTTQFSVVH